MVHGHGNLKFASFGTRIISFLLDYVIISCYIILLIGLSFLAKPLLIPLFTTNAWSAEITGFFLITLPVYLYFAICEGSKSHATWGKRKMGIVVVGIHGQSLGLGRSLFRSALKFIPWELAHFTIWHTVIPSGYPEYMIYSLFATVYGLVFVYLLCALISKNKQTVYDFIAGTAVSYKN
ncbi:RDD family protein [Paenibacillus piri]|uniref:RDD family protein n=1 Tax=Paenibacillus piri TaxID=2547395 RepID=A0A4R5KQL1_9BACL|nr:RDD family protein [Paenibacillus piri]TDF98043.1 RDD family protein [Paenibacillus piri]